MVLAKASASRCTPQNAPPPSDLAGRLQPEPTGSIITRSVKPSQVSGLSTKRAAEPSRPLVPNSTMRGPTAPRLRYADAAPGPPLNTNVIGRFAVSAVLAT